MHHDGEHVRRHGHPGRGWWRRFARDLRRAPSFGEYAPLWWGAGAPMEAMAGPWWPTWSHVRRHHRHGRGAGRRPAKA